MKDDYQAAILEAKKSIKFHIDFLEELLSHLKGTDKALRIKAAFAAYCIHKYIQENLIDDLKKLTKESENVQ